jgi:hypothetical protein
MNVNNENVLNEEDETIYFVPTMFPDTIQADWGHHYTLCLDELYDKIDKDYKEESY